MSSFHFQRLFSVVCGVSIGEYIRNRRKAFLVRLPVFMPFNGIYMFFGEPAKQTVAFMRVDNIENLCSFVKKSSWTQISEIKEQHWGGKECDFTTIDGGTIRFFQID